MCCNSHSCNQISQSMSAWLVISSVLSSPQKITVSLSVTRYTVKAHWRVKWLTLPMHERNRTAVFFFTLSAHLTCSDIEQVLHNLRTMHTTGSITSVSDIAQRLTVDESLPVQRLQMKVFTSDTILFLKPFNLFLYIGQRC